MQANDVRLLRAAAIPTILVGLVAVLVAAFVDGGKGALGAGIGVVAVGLFFAIGLIAVAYASRISPTMMMIVAMASYFVKLLVLIVLLNTFADTDTWSPRAFAWTVIVCTVCWTVAEARGFMKLRMLYVDPETKVPGMPEERGGRA
ncbi:hypothetical protein J5X84_00710 [Streptosporangiaceae bacterium NEAU-GS5]|nr:hypothetical protein [Streptosporangiaceae bacterium NEAU-GS5]